MKSDSRIEKPELDALFQRYREAPTSHVFAPLADACRKAGMLEEAIEICDRGVAENPGYTSGHVVRGKCYYDAGRPREAMASFEHVLGLDPNNLVALKYLGILAAEGGDADGARERFRHILALDPEDREIVDQLEAIETPEGVVGEAPVPEQEEVETLREIRDEDFEGGAIVLGDDEVTGSDELATMTLADIYASQGYTDKAMKIYREVLRRQPGNESARSKVAALAGEDVAPPPAKEPSAAGLEPAFEEIPGRDARPILRPAAAGLPEGGKLPAASADAAGGSDGPPEGEAIANRPRMDDGKSYEQFKRWLKNMSR
jgi:tetratricopeptide (TPR) repeat protein